MTKLRTVVTIRNMKFVWDEAKRLANIEKHGIDFVNVPSMFTTMFSPSKIDASIMAKLDTSLLDFCNFTSLLWRIPTKTE